MESSRNPLSKSFGLRVGSSSRDRTVSSKLAQGLRDHERNKCSLAKMGFWEVLREGSVIHPQRSISVWNDTDVRTRALPSSHCHGLVHLVSCLKPHPSALGGSLSEPSCHPTYRRVWDVPFEMFLFFIPLSDVRGRGKQSGDVLLGYCGCLSLEESLVRMLVALHRFTLFGLVKRLPGRSPDNLGFVFDIRELGIGALDSELSSSSRGDLFDPSCRSRGSVGGGESGRWGCC